MSDEPLATASGLPARLAWHARMAVRASRVGGVLALGGGLLLHLLIPVPGSWLAGLVAACSAWGALMCIAAAGDRPLPSARVTDPAVALETANGWDQVAHGLARAAVVLACFAVGLWVGGLHR